MDPKSREGSKNKRVEVGGKQNTLAKANTIDDDEYWSIILWPPWRRCWEITNAFGFWEPLSKWMMMMAMSWVRCEGLLMPIVYGTLSVAFIPWGWSRDITDLVVWPGWVWRGHHDRMVRASGSNIHHGSNPIAVVPCRQSPDVGWDAIIWWRVFYKRHSCCSAFLFDMLLSTLRRPYSALKHGRFRLVKPAFVSILILFSNGGLRRFHAGFWLIDKQWPGVIGCWLCRRFDRWGWERWARGWTTRRIHCERRQSLEKNYCPPSLYSFCNSGR